MKETWVIINRNLRIAASIFALQGCSPDISDSKLDEIMRDFQLEEGMEIQLVAREPVVIDPVAFAFDERGRLFVVEHRGYPDPAEGGKPAKREGRVAQIEDSDSDGVYETRTEFASDLSYPNGIMPWKGGVFVNRSKGLFCELESGSGMEVYEAYKASLSQESHEGNGNQVFVRACSSCHS